MDKIQFNFLKCLNVIYMKFYVIIVLVKYISLQLINNGGELDMKMMNYYSI